LSFVGVNYIEVACIGLVAALSFCDIELILMIVTLSTSQSFIKIMALSSQMTYMYITNSQRSQMTELDKHRPLTTLEVTSCVSEEESTPKLGSGL
jgi:hypothetical protein